MKLTRRQLKRLILEVTNMLNEESQAMPPALQKLIDIEGGGAGGGSPIWDISEMGDSILFEKQGGGPFESHEDALACYDWLERVVSGDPELEYKLTAEMRSGNDTMTGNRVYLLHVFVDPSSEKIKYITNDGAGHPYPRY